MNPTTQKEAEIIAAYKQFWAANLSSDMETFASFLVDDFSIIGSAKGETFFSRKDSIAFYSATGEELKDKAELRNRNISVQAVEEHIVILHELCDLYVLMDNGWIFYGHTRISCVMKQIEGEWKAVHQHASFPDHRTEEGRQLATEKIEQENLALKEAVQRRTAELEHKNKELEIEAALERIRAVAMGMNSPEDLIEITKVQFTELQQLGFRDMRNALIGIFHDKKDHFTDYDYSDICGGNITEIPIHGNIIIERAIKRMKSASDVFTEFVVEGQDMLEWKAFRQKNGEYDDPRIKNADSLYYYFYSVNNGIVGISTFKRISTAELDILKKFRNVFDLAYKRYLDISKAAAQAQEVRIEMALERVRSRTMAMQHSNELADTAAVLFQQIKELGFQTWSCGFFTWQKNDMVEAWMGADSGGLLPPMQIPYKKEPTHHDIYNASITGATSHVKIWQGEALQEHYKFLRTIPSVEDAIQLLEHSGLTMPDKQCYYAGFFEQGYLLLITKEPDNGLEELSRRFAKVFEQTYTRFLDLQKAESQTREAQIELSLERIRAKVTAMKASADLLDIVVTMRNEFVSLGHEANYFWHMRWLPDIYEKAMTSGDGSRIGNVMSLPRHIHGDIPLIANWENSSEPTVVYPMDTEAAIAYVIKMIDLGDFIQVDPNAPTLDDIRHIGGLTFIMARTTHGEIGYSLPGSIDQPPADGIATLVRFAAVFDLAYRRFEDLKSSERQIREGQIELALERVRARTMAMQHSDELADASFVLDSQVRSLGIQTRGCAFNIYGDNESTEWFSSAAAMLPAYITPREDFFKRAYDAGQAGEAMYIEEFAGAVCKAHYDYLLTIPVMGDALRDMIAAGLSFPETQIDHATFFKYGYLLFITLEPVPDAHEVFIRFAKVFEQTYTRFLDLQKAEAQALRAEQDLIEIKEARKKAEATLVELRGTQKQLIQAEKMASLGELTAGIAHEIQNPLNFVNNFSEVSNELLAEMNIELDKGEIVEAKAIASDIKSNLEKINQHGKRADAIVKGMLQHSQSAKGQKQPTDINALCDEYLRLSYHGIRAKDKSFNATLKTDFDDSIGKLNLIPQDMGRVIMNLLTNAFYAVNEKAQHAARNPSPQTVYQPTVSISTKQYPDKIEIKVSDNGGGIAPNIVDKIFQPFFTTKPTGQGTGLGLSLSYDIAKAHDGELTLETHVDEGSTFTLNLPAH
ncbi:MAG: hypothetical protein EOO13_01550 [Chitinophagaceae bacterium]|nr:MAG: hypothetical protein EOO13_01550 [Chitinophagaceae bacterium]